jgi:hypothetical protein
VDLVHCERTAAAIAAEAGGDALLVDGELVTERYWDALAAEVDEELRSAGSVSLADLARRHGLSAERITAALAARLGSSVHGRLESGLLYTDAHVARLAAALRGALRATASPCAVQELAAAAFGGGAEAGSGGITGTLIAELLAAGAAAGALRSGGQLWTPAVHARRQRNSVAAFYAGNGLVGYDTAARAGATRAWLAAAHPEGVHLESAMVSPALLDQLEAALEEALAEAGWADIVAHLPPSLAPADAAAAAARSRLVARTVKSGGALLADCCVVSAQFLGSLTQLARDAGTAAAAASASRRASAAPPTAEADEARAAPAKGGKGSRGSRAGGGSDSDDAGGADWSTGPKGKGGKGAKGGRAARGKQGVAPPPDARRAQPADAGAPSAAELQQLLERAHAALADAAGGALSGALAEHVRSAAAAAFAAAEQAAAAAGSDERRRRVDALTRRADAACLQLQLLAKGAALFGDDDAPLLARHLLRSCGADTADLLLLLLHADAGAPPDSAAGGVLTEAQRTALARSLPVELRPAGAALLEALAGRSVPALEAALEPLAAACGLRLPRLDKKSEKCLLAAHRRALAEQLAAEEAPPAALLLAVPLLFASRLARAVSLPGRALSAAVARLAEQLQPEEQRLLSSFHDGVVQALQLRSVEGAAAAADAKLAWLAERLPALRLLAAAHVDTDA